MRPVTLLCLMLIGPCAAVPAAADDVTAQVSWAQRAELGILVSGEVEQVHVRPGQVVARGDPLVSLDPRSFKHQVDRYSAAYRHARAALAEAEREDARAIELYDRTVLSDFERSQALIALEAARADAELVRSQLNQARLDLERAELKAPFDGIVVAVNAAVGQTVVSQLQVQPLVTIADHRRLQARADVDAGQARALSPGAEVEAMVGGDSMPGTVAYVGFEPLPSAAGGGPRYELRVDLQLPEGVSLRVGETVRLKIE